MNTKQIIRTISSLKLGIALLIGIALYSVVGTLLPQRMPHEWYFEQYPTLAPLIIQLGLYRSYSSVIFNVLMGLFMINLLGCTLLALPHQIRQAKKEYFPMSITRSHVIHTDMGTEEIAGLLRKKGFSIEESESSIRAARFRWGSLGASITHLGVLLILAAGIYGNIAAEEGFVNLLPGQEVSFDTQGFSLSLDQFYMTFQDSGAVSQYYSDLTFTDQRGKQVHETIWVNRPFKYNGIHFYQASYGWVSNLQVSDRETGDVLVEGLMRNGQDYFYQPRHITIYLHGYYPELAIGHSQEPVSLSNRELNPYYAVVVYEFGRVVNSFVVGPDESICHGDICIRFTHSQLFTGILFRSDPSFAVVSIGFAVIIIGMLVSFYFYPRFAVCQGGSIHTFSKKNGWIFFQSMKRYLTEPAKKKTRRAYVWKQ